jgi:hypothetical protein
MHLPIDFCLTLEIYRLNDWKAMSMVDPLVLVQSNKHVKAHAA